MPRKLLDYRRANQQARAEREESVDDGPTFRTALADGPGVVCVPAGSFNASGIAVPPGVTLVGEGNATTIHAIGTEPVFDQQGVARWAIRDLTLDGGSTEPWEHAENIGQVGLSIEKCWGYTVRGVTLRAFRGPAVRIAHTDIYGTSSLCDGGLLDGLTVHDNAVGVLFDKRGEYTTLTHAHLYRNGVGCVIRAGNVKVLGSNFGGNLVGLVLDDLDNGSHGVIGQCLINHNHNRSFDAKNVTNGMVVQGCCFYYGEMRLEQCKGVHVQGCQIGCEVVVSGPGVNRFSGNYFAEEPPKVDLSQAAGTLWDGNFCAAGPLPSARQ